MNITDSVNAVNSLRHEELRDWLKRALQGNEELPRLLADESYHLGVMSFEKMLAPPTRRSIGNACVDLLRDFCEQGQGEADYLQELLFLASMMEQELAIVPMLARLACRFGEMPDLAMDIRYTILSILVDASPPQPIQFWLDILQQEPIHYAGMALSGVLAVAPMQADELLKRMPDDRASGEYAALNIDLTWDNLPANQRGQFVQVIENALPHCRVWFAGPIRKWVASKNTSMTTPILKNSGLRDALGTALSNALSSKARSPKLHQPLAA
jgi:hypothetical protein